VKRIPRILAGVAATVSLALVASACNSQPDAARVDGTSINQSALDAELSSLSYNKAYIAAVDKASASSGERVAGSVGGTYNALWSAHVLTGAVTAAAVRYYLDAHGLAPDRADVDVAGAVEAADYGHYWPGFPASYRHTLSVRTADLARLGPPALPAAELRDAYKQLSGYLFSEVCARAPVFAPGGSSGKVDFAVSHAQAEAYASSVAAGGGSSSAAVSNAPADCYTPAQLAAQPDTFASAVETLPVATRAGVVRTSGGYEVIVVTKRTPLALDPTLRATIEAVVASNSGGSFPRLEAVLAHAKVFVNPEYGSWQGSASQGYQVVPPRSPAAS